MYLLETGFFGTIIIFITMVSRKLLINKLSKKTFIILWYVALLRLILPFSFSSVFSIYSFLGQSSFSPMGIGIMQENDRKTLTEIEIKGNVQMESENNNTIYQKSIRETDIDSHLMPTTVKEKESISYLLGKFIWAIGFFSCTIFFLITYILSYRKFQISLPIENKFIQKWLLSHKICRKISIRQSDYIVTPLTYGIFRPVILMPKTIDWENTEQLQYILTHEFIHIRRLDAVTKLLLVIAVCIHWFNPFVWIMYCIANRDIELSCDEAVIWNFGEDARKDYALTLINMEEIKSGMATVGNYFSSNAAKERITAIMKTKKRSMIVSIFAVFLIIGIILVFATSAVPRKDKDIFKNLSETPDIETALSEKDQRELLEAYNKYGIYEISNVLYYNDKMIRYLNDQYAEITINKEGGQNTNYKKIYTYFNIDGEVDLGILRDKKTERTEPINTFPMIRNIILTEMKNLTFSSIPEESRKKLAKKAVKEEDYRMLSKLAPLIPVDSLDKIVKKLIEEKKSTQNLMLYASENTIIELAEKSYQEHGITGVRKFLPYMPEEAISLLIRKAVKEGNYQGIGEMALFTNNNIIDKIAMELIEKGKKVEDILPYISRDLRKELEKNSQ